MKSLLTEQKIKELLDEILSSKVNKERHMEITILSREQAEYYHFLKTGELTIQLILE